MISRAKSKGTKTGHDGRLQYPLSVPHPESDSSFIALRHKSYQRLSMFERDTSARVCIGPGCYQHRKYIYTERD